MGGKKRRRVSEEALRRTKKAGTGTGKKEHLDGGEEEVIKLNIILDLDLEDEEKKRIESKDTPTQAQLNLREYTSRGKTFRLTPFQVVVPSVESLLERYGKFLAADSDSVSKTSRSSSLAELELSQISPVPSRSPSSSPEPVRSQKLPRRRHCGLRSSRSSSTTELDLPHPMPSSSSLPEPVRFQKICRRQNRKDLKESTAQAKARVSAQSEATLGETNLGSDNVEVTKMDRVPPERAELSGKDDGTNCSDRNTNLSGTEQNIPPLPSRITLRKNWMKKLLSKPKPVEVKLNELKVHAGTEQGVPNQAHVIIDTKIGCSGESIPHQIEVLESEAGVIKNIQTADVDGDSHDDDISNPIDPAYDGDENDYSNREEDDPADLPEILDEIGNVKNMRLERILVKQEKTNPNESRAMIDGSSPEKSEANFVQLMEQSDDEEGPSEDPLMLADAHDCDISVIEDDDVQVLKDKYDIPMLGEANGEVALVRHPVPVTSTHASVSTTLPAVPEASDPVDTDKTKQPPSNPQAKITPEPEVPIQRNHLNNTKVPQPKSLRFQCPYCQEIFDKSPDLELHGQMFHVKYKNSNKPFPCPECRKRFSHIRWLRSHQKQMHKESGMDSYGYQDQESVEMGEEEASFSRLGRDCHTEERDASAAKIPIHTSGRRSATTARICTHSSCGITFDSSGDLQKHVALVHRRLDKRPKRKKKRKYSCPKCSSSFSWPSGLLDHLQYFHKKEKANTPPTGFEFACSECQGHSFSSVQLLSQHKRQVHRGTPRPPPSQDHREPIPSTSEDPVSSSRPQDPHLVAHRSEPDELTLSEASAQVPVITLSDDETDPVVVYLSPVTCCFCDSRFKNNEQLIEHSSIHASRVKSMNGRKRAFVFECPFSSCRLQFNSIMNLKLHVGTHNSDESSTMTGESHSSESQSQPESNKYFCSCCPMSFVWFKSLEAHELAVHDRIAVDNSKARRKQTRSRRQLSLKGYVCIICDNLTFSSPDDLQRHNQVVHGEEVSIGLICQTGSSGGNQGQHIQQNTLPEPEFTAANTSSSSNEIQLILTDGSLYSGGTVSAPELHKCLACSQVFKNLMELQMHSLFHEVSIRFRCSTCSSEFIEEQDLQNHLETDHSSILPHHRLYFRAPATAAGQFKCCLCEVVCKSMLELQVHHEAVHTTDTDTDQATRCHVCGVSLSRRALLKQHMRVVHKLESTSTGAGADADILSFACQYCKQAVDLRKSDLAMHIIHCVGQEQSTDAATSLSPAPLQLTSTNAGGANSLCHSSTNHSDTDTTTVCEKVKNLDRMEDASSRIQRCPNKKSKKKKKQTLKSSNGNEGVNCPACGIYLSQNRNLSRHALFMHNLVMTKNTGKKCPTFSCRNCADVVQLQESEVARHLLCAKKCGSHSKTMAGANLDDDPNEMRSGCLDVLVPGRREDEAELLNFGTLENRRGVNNGQEIQSRNAETPNMTVNPYTCSTCDKGFSHRKYLLLHKSVFHGETASDSSSGHSQQLPSPFIPEAQTQSQEQTAAPTEETQVNQELFAPTLAPTPASKFRCAICLEEFKFDQELQTHVKESHPHSLSTSKPYECGTCCKKFSTIIGLKIHIPLVHGDGFPVEFRDGKRIYPCPFCSVELNSVASRAEHIGFKHGGEMPYKCKHCDKHFPTCRTRNIHQKSHAKQSRTVTETEGDLGRENQQETPFQFQAEPANLSDRDPGADVSQQNSGIIYSDQFQQQIPDYFASVENVVIPGGIMMKGEVEDSNIIGEEEVPQFSFQVVEPFSHAYNEPGDPYYTAFSIVNHAPLLDE